VIIFDVEANGLDPTKLWTFSYSFVDSKKVYTLTDYQDIINFINQENQKETYFIGHNIIMWDIPFALKKLLKVFPKNVIDTLGLSWYLYSHKTKHGLEDWGEYFGIPKPKIKSEEWLGPLPEESEKDFIEKMKYR